MIPERSVDFLYLAFNRLEFTIETFSTLLRTTDWNYVNELVVYDDGSVDGTREWLEQNVHKAPAPVRFQRTNFGSPVTAMNDFIRRAKAPILAKTDSDAMLPPGWLSAGLGVMDRHPGLDFLGIEAMYPHVEDPAALRTYAPAHFISGLGLYRRRAFERHGLPAVINRYFGLEEWQGAHPEIVRGWITPALPVFLLDRLPMEPWRGFSASYIQKGWQRDWQGYDPSSRLWSWWLNPQPQTVLSRPRVVCALRIKNEEERIGRVLESVRELCDQIFVFDDHSTDRTAAICRAFGERLTWIESPFTGLDEARDKNYLLRALAPVNPEWVLWIDGDEELEPGGADAIRRAIADPGAPAVFSLRIGYVWDDEEHVRVDGLWGRFTRPSLFRFAGHAVGELCFFNTRFGGNLHCGNVPTALQGQARYLDVRLKHYGYMSREQRRRKYEFYNRVDPNNAAEDCYRHLAEIPGALHAPGPPRIVPWSDRSG